MNGVAMDEETTSGWESNRRPGDYFCPGRADVINVLI